MSQTIVNLFQFIEIQHDERKFLARSHCKLQVSLQLHFESTPVIAVCQSICESLLLQLGEQMGLVDGYRNLIGYGVQQQQFTFSPAAGGIV